MTAQIPLIDAVHVVDDDPALRDSLSILLQAHGFNVSTFESAEHFLGGKIPQENGCVLIDVNMPGMSGIDLLAEFRRRGFQLPCIVMTGAGQVQLAVKAMKAGAVDFLEKPFDVDILIESLREALQRPAQPKGQKAASEKLSRLTPREREVMMGMAGGQQNKAIANSLGISPRTVEIHRARVMTKLEANSLAEVVKLALAHANGTA
jgi:two-component system, LuxR family, response regulator FixJ